MTTPGSFNTDTSDMAAVHRALLGALDSAAAYVGQAGDDTDRVEVIGSFYENVLELLNVHHGGEDKLLYPLLEQRCGSGDLAEIARINDQHKVLDAPLDAGRSAIATWRSTPSPESAQALVDALAAIDTTLRPHLTDEEMTVVPLCTTWISPEEWAQLPAHAVQSFRADKVWLALGLVFEQLTQEQRDAILTGMPPEFQKVVTEQWMPAFNTFITEVRR